MSRQGRVFLTLTTFTLVLLWRFPHHGHDTDPPQNFNVFNQQISNESPLIALALAALSAGIVWFILARFERSR